jgi:molecular chaperone GrpE (heat shock protein)
MIKDPDNEDQGRTDSENDFKIGIRFEDTPEDAEDRKESTEAGCQDSGLQIIADQLQELSASFESKLKYDAHKNKIIDELHQELQKHREGLVQKHLHSMVTDIIKVIDDIRKFKSHYETADASEYTPAQLLDFMEEIAADLEDLFSWQGITAFTCDVKLFDNTRQRVVKKLETDDPSMDKAIAQSLRPGYQWDGKILRPELVSVYVYDNTEKGDMC